MMQLSYLIWMIIIIVCCISFFFLSKREGDKKRLWRKIALIGLCLGSALHFPVDLTVNAMATDKISLGMHILWYFTVVGVFLTVFALVYFVPQDVRPLILSAIVLLLGGLFMLDVYTNNYGLATGKSSCGDVAVRPPYVKLLWCSKD